MNSTMTDSAWPLIVRMDGIPDVVALMNRKAFRKSLESGSPWIVHPITGRVLPWPGEPGIISLVAAPGRFDLTLPKGADAEPYGKDAPPDVNPDNRSEMGEAQKNTTDGQDRNGVMEQLSVLIAERHRTMPDGSYTTHLFEQGMDKILKKTGEEAVELLLARNKNDVIYESADLVYHLLVMLEASGLSWYDVTDELARRYTE